MRRLRAALVALGLISAVVSSGCDDRDLRRHAQSVTFDLASREFTCLREFKSDFGGVHVEYVERVRSAGDGKNIVVELVSLNGKHLAQITDPVERQAFLDLSATLAAGGGARALFQRDPHIDSVDQMAANYFITLLEAGREPIRPGGEPSLTFRVEPRVQDRPFYVLTVSTTVDHEGFPLECQEYAYTPVGPVLVSDMRVVSAIKWGESGGPVEPLQQPVDSRVELGSLLEARDRARQVGVTLLLPKYGTLPYGFQLAKVEQVTFTSNANSRRQIERTELFRFVYSDGVERIDFVEHLPVDAIPDIFKKAGANDLVMLQTFGTLSIATLVHDGTQVVVESRVASDRFHALMKSLVPLR
jgi:hypothetical protein